MKHPQQWKSYKMCLNHKFHFSTFLVSWIVFSHFNEHGNNKSELKIHNNFFLAVGNLLFAIWEGRTLKIATVPSEREIIRRRNNQKIGKLRKKLSFHSGGCGKKGTWRGRTLSGTAKKIIFVCRKIFQKAEIKIRQYLNSGAVWSKWVICQCRLSQPLDDFFCEGIETGILSTAKTWTVEIYLQLKWFSHD